MSLYLVTNPAFSMLPLDYFESDMQFKWFAYIIFCFYSKSESLWPFACIKCSCFILVTFCLTSVMSVNFIDFIDLTIYAKIRCSRHKGWERKQSSKSLVLTKIKCSSRRRDIKWLLVFVSLCTSKAEKQQNVCVCLRMCAKVSACSLYMAFSCVFIVYLFLCTWLYQ